MMEAARLSPIYLDHNATTPTDPRVVAAMLPYFTEVFGNPSSVDHVHGNRARTAVEDARGRVAAALGARDNEIVFTGSCTEASNIAILGAARARPERRRVVTSAVEHPAVLETFRQLEREGFHLTVVGVDAEGRVDPDEVAAAVGTDTGLVSIMAANNEVGTLQPIAAIGAACEAVGALFHTDLAQVMAHRRVDVTAESIHLASVSAHKAYGPKGIGALYVRSRSPRARLAATVFGGGQERGLRSGTLAVPMIVGMAEALDIAGREGAADAARLRAMCGALVARITATVEGAMLNGPTVDRLPGNVSLSIAGVEPLALMHRLNPVASFSAASACATGKVETSHVLLAMFGDVPRARQAFRVSPGRWTTAAEVEFFGEAVATASAELRRFAA